MPTQQEALATIGPSLTMFFRKAILKEYVDKFKGDNEVTTHDFVNLVLMLITGFAANELDNLADLSGINIDTLKKHLLSNIEEGLKHIVSYEERLM